MIESVVTEIVEAFADSPYSFEIVLVDDGSTDDTGEAAGRLNAEHPDVLRVISEPYNKGNGSAVRTGIRAARGRLIGCMDSDGQHDPRELLRMIPLAEDYDLVIGARTADYRGSWHRKLANRLFSALASWVTRFPVEDLTSGCRTFRTRLVRRYVHLFPARFSYPTTSTLAFIKGGHNVVFVPIAVRPRLSGSSKIEALGDGWRFLVIILKIIVIYEPLRVFFPVAMGLFLLGAASTAYSIWSSQQLFVPNSAVVLFVVGVLVVLLGLIAEQIAALQVAGTDEGNG